MDRKYFERKINTNLKEATEIVLQFVKDLDETVYELNLQDNQIFINYQDRLNYFSTK